MRSLRSENKAVTRLRSPGHWADIEVRSAVRCDGTRRIERVESIGRTWPTTTLDGDAADRAVMSASAHRIGVGSRRASGNSGARSRPLVGYGVRLSSRSAMRPSTATSGVIESRAEACTCISAALPNNAENGTDPTIPEVGWPANVPSVNDPLVLSIEAESATSKPIP